MRIHQLINNLFGSNTYILESSNGQIVIIDPGEIDNNQIFSLISANNWTIKSIILTHEHADHCIGLNQLFEISPFKTYCTTECAENIGNSKKNLSKFIETIEPFEIHLPIRVIKDNEVINILDHNFTVLKTPGHSQGSICLYSNNYIFTGDTILNRTKTPLNLPNSDKNKYKESIRKILNILKPDMTIYPGHGLPFKVDSNDLSKSYSKILSPK